MLFLRKIHHLTVGTKIIAAEPKVKQSVAFARPILIKSGLISETFLDAKVIVCLCFFESNMFFLQYQACQFWQPLTVVFLVTFSLHKKDHWVHSS